MNTGTTCLHDAQPGITGAALIAIAKSATIVAGLLVMTNLKGLEPT